jgi:hypothetical protein
LKNVTIAAEKVSTGFAQPGELVVPPFEVFGRKLILAPHKIPDETCQTFAVGVIVPLEIEDREDGCIIEPKTCAEPGHPRKHVKLPWRKKDMGAIYRHNG